MWYREAIESILTPLQMIKTAQSIRPKDVKKRHPAVEKQRHSSLFTLKSFTLITITCIHTFLRTLWVAESSHSVHFVTVNTMLSRWGAEPTSPSKLKLLVRTVRARYPRITSSFHGDVHQRQPLTSQETTHQGGLLRNSSCRFHGNTERPAAEQVHSVLCVPSGHTQPTHWLKRRSHTGRRSQDNKPQPQRSLSEKGFILKTFGFFLFRGLSPSAL